MCVWYDVCVRVCLCVCAERLWGPEQEEGFNCLAVGLWTVIIVHKAEFEHTRKRNMRVLHTHKMCTDYTRGTHLCLTIKTRGPLKIAYGSASVLLLFLSFSDAHELISSSA